MPLLCHRDASGSLQVPFLWEECLYRIPDNTVPIRIKERNDWLWCRSFVWPYPIGRIPFGSDKGILLRGCLCWDDLYWSDIGLDCLLCTGGFLYCVRHCPVDWDQTLRLKIDFRRSPEDNDVKLNDIISSGSSKPKRNLTLVEKKAMRLASSLIYEKIEAGKEFDLGWVVLKPKLSIDKKSVVQVQGLLRQKVLLKKN
jgi:hypothetical protein